MRISKSALAELERIAAEHGGLLRPRDVVEAARDPQSPLHGYFCWDDHEAAERWRLEQAQALIRAAVTIVREDHPPVRAFVSLVADRAPGGGPYRATADVLAAPDLRSALLEQAKRELAAFRRKYAVLSELAKVFAAIEELLSQEPEREAVPA